MQELYFELYFILNCTVCVGRIPRSGLALGAVFSPDIYIHVGYNAIVIIKLGLYPYPWANMRHYILAAAAADYKVMFT